MKGPVGNARTCYPLLICLHMLWQDHGSKEPSCECHHVTFMTSTLQLIILINGLVLVYLQDILVGSRGTINPV